MKILSSLKVSGWVDFFMRNSANVRQAVKWLKALWKNNLLVESLAIMLICVCGATAASLNASPAK